MKDKRKYVGRETVNVHTNKLRELAISIPVYEINGNRVVFLNSLSDSDLTTIKEGEKLVCDD